MFIVLFYFIDLLLLMATFVYFQVRKSLPTLTLVSTLVLAEPYTPKLFIEFACLCLVSLGNHLNLLFDW